MIAALLLGLAAAGVVFVIRAVVMDRWPLLMLSKPLSCDLCMSWWSALAFSLVDWHSVQHLFAGVALSVGIIKAVGRLSEVGALPIDLPATLPESTDLGDTHPVKE